MGDQEVENMVEESESEDSDGISTFESFEEQAPQKPLSQKE